MRNRQYRASLRVRRIDSEQIESQLCRDGLSVGKESGPDQGETESRKDSKSGRLYSDLIDDDLICQPNSGAPEWTFGM
jgi:hypothetical protein